MALVYIDGFEHYGSSDLTAKGWTGTGTNTITTGRLSGNALRNQDGDDRYIRRELPSAMNRIVVGCAGYFPSISASQEWLRLLDANGSEQISLRFSGSYQLVVSRNGTPLATSTNTIKFNTWTYIEFGVTIGSSGSYEVRVNDSSTGWIPYAVGNTQAQASNTVGVLRFDNPSTDFRIDDLYVTDSEFMGDCRITALRPTSDGTYQEFTPGGTLSGSHWGQVDDPTLNTSDYVWSDAANAIDSYGFDDLTSNYFSVKGVQLSSYLTKADAGTRAVASFVRSNGVDYTGSDKYLGAGSWIYHSSIWQASPDTGAAWTIDEINAAEFGLKVTV